MPSHTAESKDKLTLALEVGRQHVVPFVGESLGVTAVTHGLMGAVVQRVGEGNVHEARAKLSQSRVS